MITLYLIDTKTIANGGLDYSRQWADILGSEPIPLKWCNSKFTEENGNPIPANTIILAHDSPNVLRTMPIDQRRALIKQIGDIDSVLILVGGAAPSSASVSDLPSNVYRRHATVAVGFDPGFAKCFSRFLRRYAATRTPEFFLLEPEGSDALALRLLCEAWQIVNDQGTSKCNGIPIQAPSTIEEWLAPFGTSPTSAGVAALMGVAKGAATNLFNAVERPKENNVQDAVSAYLAAVASKQ